MLLSPDVSGQIEGDVEVPGGASGSEQRRADAREAVGLDDRHGVPSAFVPLTDLLLDAIVSKRRYDINLP
jgi:hypothetical protein